MTIVLFSDEKYELNAIQTIKSLTYKITDDVKIVYYTVGFESKFKYKNLITHKVEINPLYYRFNFYKPELCLLALDQYPDTHYLYTDIDILFSNRLDLKKLEHNEPYPLASLGPVEFPCIWETIENKVHVYTENNLANYFGIKDRTMRYCWSSILSFNNESRDFLEEWMSMCNNKFLLKQTYKMFTYQDETPFNVCLWKRGATKNLGFAFLNTEDIHKLIYTEENRLNNFSYGECLDVNNFDWESFTNYDDVIAYHGLKDVNVIETAVTYLLDNKKVVNSIFILDCYADTPIKIDILKKSIASIKQMNLNILLVSHGILPTDVISLVDYYLYDADNTFNEINFYAEYTYSNADYNITSYIAPHLNLKGHEYPIIKSIKNSLAFAKNLGYNNFIFSEFDNIYTENDITKLHRILFNTYKKYKFTVFENDNSYETICFAGNTEYMLDKFNSYFPNNIEEYNAKFTHTYPYKLELFMYNMLHPYLSDGLVIYNTYYNFFDDNKNIFNVSSIRAEILPSQHNKYYLVLTNLDSIIYKFDVMCNNIIHSYYINSASMPSIELSYECMIDINVYDDHDILLKTLQIEYNPKLNSTYDTYGKVILK